MALSSENRLKSKRLISLVQKKGASWKTPFFRAVFLPSRFNVFQSLVIPSKKNIDNRATERNKVRRKINGILQQMFSSSQKEGKLFPKNLYIIFPYTSSIDASTEDLTNALEKMMYSPNKSRY